MNNKGVVLMVVLWVLMILALIAWGLGRRASVEVSLLETYRGKLRSYAAARSGLYKVLDLMRKSPSIKDTLYASGVALQTTESPEKIFSHIEVGKDDYAIVPKSTRNFNNGENEIVLRFGIGDEGGRLNLNALNAANCHILSALFQIKGLSLSKSEALTLNVLNYVGVSVPAVNTVSSGLDVGIKPKNRFYENILELLEVNGMTQEIFDKIKNDVTVYGDALKRLWINTDTASNDLIQAVANNAARINPSINASDIVREAYVIRDGADGRSFTADDGAGTLAGSTDPNWPAVLQEGISNYYRVKVVGIDKRSESRTVLEVVIHQVQGHPSEIISWQRDIQ